MRQDKLERPEDAYKNSIRSFGQGEKGEKEYAVIFLNAQGIITSWNKDAQRIKGFARDEVVGRHYSFLYHYKEEDHPSELEIAVHKGYFQEERIQKRKDGTFFLADIHITPLFNERGDLKGFVKVIRGLSDLNRQDREISLISQGSESSHMENTLSVSKELIEYKERYERVLNNLQEGCAIVSYDWICLYVNKVCARHLHKNPQELIGNKLSEILAGEDKRLFFQILQRSMSERIEMHDEFEFYFPGGDPGWYEIDVQPVKEGILVLSLDITARKRAETNVSQSLKLSERKAAEMNAVIESMPDAVFMGDTSGRIIRCNTNALRMWGVDSLKELPQNIKDLGKKFNIRNSETGEILTEESLLFTRTLKGEQVEQELLLTNVKTGRDYFIRSAWAPIMEDGKVTGIVAVNSDISERKKAEEQLNFNEEKYRLLFNFLPFGVIISDKAGNIVETNKTSDRLFQSAKPPFFRKRIDDPWAVVRNDKTIMPVEEYASVRALNENRLIDNVEMGIVKENDIIVWVNAIAAPLPLKDYGVIVVYNDISEKIKQENQIREYVEQLRALNATKDKLFSVIAHDLRSPFNSLVNWSDFLIQSFQTFQEDRVLEILQMLNDSAKTAFNLLDNLLQWSRAQTGHLNFSPEIMNLNRITSNILSFIEIQALNKNVDLKNKIDENLLVSTDMNMLNTVLRNLISNAIKFSDPDGIVAVEANETMDEIEISVTDTGRGIPNDVLGKLLTSGFNHSSEGTAHEKGTGLGLILCLEFVEKMGGRIWAESVVGKGSSFRFTIPKSKTVDKPFLLIH